MITVTTPIYYQQTKKKVVMLGMNWFKTTHFMHLDKAKKFIHSVVEDRIEGEPILEGTIHAHYVVYLKRKGTDGGNVRAVLEKFILDGIKHAGFIADDHAEIIVSDSAEYHYDKTHPRIEVTLTKK